jgi:hypothetical protein
MLPKLIEYFLLTKYNLIKIFIETKIIMTIRERIMLYLDSKSISKYRFYKETGISNGFLDKEGAIGSDKCVNICSHYTDLDPEWLLLGMGSMLKSTQEITELPANNVIGVKQLISKIGELTAENENLRSVITDLKSYKKTSNTTIDKVADSDVQYIPRSK